MWVNGFKIKYNLEVWELFILKYVFFVVCGLFNMGEFFLIRFLWLMKDSEGINFEEFN